MKDTRSTGLSAFSDFSAFQRFSVDQVVDQVIFVEKVQKGLSDSLIGNINSKEEAKQKLGKWLK